MTFADLQRIKRVSDPQISPSGKWVMFSVTEVDLGKNLKVNHLWVVPMGGAAGGAGRGDLVAGLTADSVYVAGVSGVQPGVFVDGGGQLRQEEGR
jgi:dipeptidyl aminopeptidase/acylaminoacyl peptidase